MPNLKMLVECLVWRTNSLDTYIFILAFSVQYMEHASITIYPEFLVFSVIHNPDFSDQ